MTTKNLNAHRFFKIATLLFCVLVAGCLTVNVNFPERAVQKAADSFVKDLYEPASAAENTKVEAANESNAVKNAVKKSSKKKSTKVPASAAPTAPSGQPAMPEPGTWLFSIGVSEALAQEINTASTKAQTIKARMKDRIPDIRNWKLKGVICETADALLVLKHPEKAGGDASAIAKLVKDENNDRDALYAELQDVNKLTDRNQTKIRKFFAAAFKEHSPPETCFEQ